MTDPTKTQDSPEEAPTSPPKNEKEIEEEKKPQGNPVDDNPPAQSK
jgi:hypothetical protein